MKSFLFTLILCNCFFSYAQENKIKYINPFQPIWCEGDDLTYANPKPTVLYKEVEGTRIEIPNMPAFKMQSELGECRAFSLAVLIQKYTCDKWKNEIPDCKNPPADLDISYFGLLMFTNNDLNNKKTFQPNQKGAKSMYEIINEVSKTSSFILESCKPFYKLTEAFSTSGQAGIDKKNEFIAYLKNIYETKKAKTEAEVEDCPQCLIDIYNFTGMEAKFFNLKKALSQDSFDKFMYVLFFDGCKLEGFADGYRPQAFPDDSFIATTEDIKNKIIEGIKKRKPVLLPYICMSTDSKNECNGGHSVVISGYRKCYDSNNNYKELFKVHNSWGLDWQKNNNEGWVDATILSSATTKLPNQNVSSRIMSGSVIWLE